MKYTLLSTIAFLCLSGTLNSAMAETSPSKETADFKSLALPKKITQAEGNQPSADTPRESDGQLSAQQQLYRALKEAYLFNPELKAQRKALEVLNERVPQAMSASLPQLNLNYEKGRQRIRSGGVAWNYGDTKRRVATVTQPVFRGGRTWYGTKSARNEVSAAQQRLRQTEQGILLNTLTAYMDVVSAEAVLALSNKNVSVLKEQLRASKQRFEVGEDTRTDVSQSEARLALARSRVSQSESDLAAARARFERLTGNRAVNLPVPPIPENLPTSLDEAIERAKASNPNVREQEFLQEAADDGIYAQAGSLLPTVDIRGQMSRLEGGGIFGNTDFDEDSVVVSVNLPVFQGGSRYSAVRQAKETYHQRRFELIDTVNRAVEQATSTWQAYQAAKAAMESDLAAIRAAEIALDGVKQEQKYGARTTLEVLDGERELFNAEVNYVTSQRNHIVSAYQVLTVSGDMTADRLQLDAERYDAKNAFEDVEYQFIGF